MKAEGLYFYYAALQAKVEKELRTNEFMAYEMRMLYSGKNKHYSRKRKHCAKAWN